MLCANIFSIQESSPTHRHHTLLRPTASETPPSNSLPSRHSRQARIGHREGKRKIKWNSNRRRIPPSLDNKYDLLPSTQLTRSYERIRICIQSKRKTGENKQYSRSISILYSYFHPYTIHTHRPFNPVYSET